MAILVAADFDAAEWAAWWPLLQRALPAEQLVRDRDAAPTDTIDVALVANPPRGSLRDLPGLRLIQSLWAGVDLLLADPGVPAQVPLARMVDPSMNEAMAQTALWAVLSLQRGFFGYAAQQRARVWQPQPWRRADETTIAVLGLGQMGRAATAAAARRSRAWSTPQ
jgi:glyoxylate/hydroxypyruvate reductase A